MEAVVLKVWTVTTSTDLDGNTTSTRLERDIDGCLFEPQQSVERTDPRSPGVLSPAKFYAPEPVHLDADDEVEAGGTTWQVVGGSMVWGTQTEIPVRRVG